MRMSSVTVMCGWFLMSAGGATLLAQTPAQTGQQQPKTQQQQSMKASQVTLTGCLRQTTDDPNVFALVSAATDKGSATGTSGTSAKGTGTASSMTKFPLYRLEDKGQKLKGHLGQRIEVTGTVTPAKDEKGVDIIASRSENIGVPTTTITTIDLKPAPRLDVKSVRKIEGECPSAPAKKQ